MHTRVSASTHGGASVITPPRTSPLKPSDRLDMLAAREVEHLTTPQQIAAHFIERADRGGCTEDDLLDEGFTPEEIAAHGDEAKQIARALFTRRIERAAKTVEQGAAIIVSHLPSEAELHRLLREAGWTNHEIATHWHQMRALAAKQFAGH